MSEQVTLTRTINSETITLTRVEARNGVDGEDADAAAIAAEIHAATSKATPVDADELPLVDSAASNGLKKLTWANLKATAKAYFDTLYQPLASALTSWAAVTRGTGFDTAAAINVGSAGAFLTNNGSGTSLSGIGKLGSANTWTGSQEFTGAIVINYSSEGYALDVVNGICRFQGGIVGNLTGDVTGNLDGIATSANNAVSTAALSTTSLSVNVSLAAAPTTGQVLKATSATTATWQSLGTMATETAANYQTKAGSFAIAGFSGVTGTWAEANGGTGYASYHVKALHGLYRWSNTVGAYTASNTGTAATATNTDCIDLATGATSGSVAFLRSNIFHIRPWHRGANSGRGVCNWSLRTIHSVRVFVTDVTGADTVARVLLGQVYTNTTATDLTSANKGIGFKIIAGLVYVQVADGSTLTTTSTGVTLSSLSESDLTIDSHGNGSWDAWVNGTLVVSGTGAPTGNSTAGHNALQMSLTNGTTAAIRQLYIVSQTSSQL